MIVVQMVSPITVLAARESDPLAGRNGSLGMSDCQGELSALRTILKRVGAFALKPCIAANLIKRTLHRSGRTSSSSQFRRPTSLLWLLTNRRRGLSTEPRELVTLNAIDADKGLDQRMAPSPPCHRCYTRCVSCVSTPTHITW